MTNANVKRNILFWDIEWLILGYSQWGNGWFSTVLSIR